MGPREQDILDILDVQDTGIQDIQNIVDIQDVLHIQDILHILDIQAGIVSPGNRATDFIPRGWGYYHIGG